MNDMTTDFSLTRNDGQVIPWSTYAGQVRVVVNVASRCGFTNQYAALQALHTRYRQRGFTVLAFPCNQFGQQEPDDDTAIMQFCQRHYEVTFPLFAKVDVNGASAHPLFQWLKGAQRGVLGTTKIKWNFTKFLVDRDDRVIARFAPRDTPDKMTEAIELLL